MHPELKIRLSRVWRWLVRLYCLACVAEVSGILAFHALNPQYRGIPRWLFVFVNLPASGVEALPFILVVETVLAAKRVYRRQAFVVQAVLIAIAWAFCLQGLRQDPPRSPVTYLGVS